MHSFVAGGGDSGRSRRIKKSTSASSQESGTSCERNASKFCEVKFMHLITVLIKHCPKHICGERVAGCTTGADPSGERAILTNVDRTAVFEKKLMNTQIEKVKYEFSILI